MPDSTAGITRLDINHYRSYEQIRLRVTGTYIVLTGPNGVGKTNILEAISLFSSNRGFRKADLQDLGRTHDPLPWSIALQIKNHTDYIEMGTGLHDKNTKRIHRINGHTCYKTSTYSDFLNIVWLTPAMDGILIGPPEERRRFLDRLVCGIDPEHAKRLQQYSQALRQRSFLLKQPTCDLVWIKSLEEILAAEGIAISASRAQVIELLQQSINQGMGIFPQTDLALKGQVDDWIQQMPALEAEEKLLKTFETTRTEDRETGGALEGPHRSDWLVFHRLKQIAAPQCSTGEQKALLLTIILAFARLQKTFHQRLNILLLDDVIAHLDQNRQIALFDEIKNLEIQTWMTGTDPNSFHYLKEDAQFFNIIPGAIDTTQGHL